MSKFCENCGSMLSDDAAFCGNCGAKQEDMPVQAEQPVYVEQPAYTEQPQEVTYNGWENVEQPEQKNIIQKVIDWVKAKPLVAGGIALAAVAAVVGILYFCGVFGNKYDEAIDNYIAVLSGETDESDIKKLYPESAWEDIDFEEISDELDEMMEWMPDDLEYSYEVTSEKEITGSIYSDLKDMMNEYYYVDPADVGEAYTIDIELTAKTQGESSTQTAKGAAVVEIDGQWYLIMIETDDGELVDMSFPEF